uniref:5'-deoxynucleotidase HDDC2 n=1 Tax=Angiostrongylus cantonensis TaxID=6313 RepID=A0A0K0DB92_ANGCA
MTVNGVMELLSALDSLKHLKRTGWIKMGVPEPETVACHMYRMAVLAMSLEGQIEGLDVGRTVTMSLVHDLAEAIVGDITPYCSVSTEEKHDLENKACTAIHKIAAYVPVAAVGEQWIEQWKEYEAQETLEAKVVKHLDKFDMVAQAFEYERKYGLDLEQFFESTKTAFTIAPFVEWDCELRIRRDLWLQRKQ